MCGIRLELLLEIIEKIRNKEIDALLKARGPDSSTLKILKLTSSPDLFGIFTGCVLWLQGDQPTQQPLIDEVGNVFLWNGDDLHLSSERLRETSDSRVIFEALRNKCEADFLNHISQIEGPWSFIFFNALSCKIYFGRDILGRRSLLWSHPQNREWLLTSVAKREEQLEEVPAVGIFALDVRKLAEGTKHCLTLHKYKSIYERETVLDLSDVHVSDTCLAHPITEPLKTVVPSEELDSQLKSLPPVVERLCYSLDEELIQLRLLFERSLKKRVLAAPSCCKNCSSESHCSHPKFAVLFSGGLDSSLIALFLHETLDPLEQIDLLNVSFESRDRVGSFDSPDRQSGVECWKQLQRLHPSRSWNFVQIDVTAEELKRERRDHIHHLIAPLHSVLDDSIGCALYFAARGSGIKQQEPYVSPARIVFSGLGADEQCAGYSKHRGRFQNEGWSGLVHEISCEMSRIHLRNLGRDDRVVSHHGRSVRFPFLDEGVVNFLNSVPIWKKANLYLPRGVGEKLLLRALAFRHGLTYASCLPKRAIQFGCKIAKLENAKEKGHQQCERLK